MRFIMKIFALGCMVGFSVQVGYYFQLYLTWPTRIDVSYKWNNWIEIPTHTICNNNRYRKSEVIKMFPELKNSKTIRDITIPHLLLKRSVTIEDLQRLGHQYQNMFTRNSWNKNHSDLYFGKKGNRYLFNGNITGELDNIIGIYLMNHSSKRHHTTYLGTDTKSVGADIQLQTEEYLEPQTMERKALLALHDAYELVRMDAVGLSVFPGQALTLVFTKTVINLLPEPYRSQCRDYRVTHRESGFLGPVSKTSCIIDCFSKFYKRFGDVPVYAPTLEYPIPIKYYKNVTLISDRVRDGSRFITLYVWRDCKKECPVDCEFAKYSVTQYTSGFGDWKIRLPEPFKELNVSEQEARKNGYLSLSILIVPLAFHYQVWTMQPLIQGIEVFGYFGGTMGMWLGFSLLSMPDIFVQCTARLFQLCKNKHVLKRLHRRRPNGPLITPVNVEHPEDVGLDI